MKEKILKLAKRLNSFKLEDLSLILEVDSMEIKNHIDSLLETGELKLLAQNSYLYCQKEQKYKPTNKKLLSKKYKNRVIFTEKEIENLINSRNTSESYKNSPNFIQKKVDKYVLLLEKANGLTGSKLECFIDNEWNKNHPEFKTSKTCYIRARQILKSSGMEGLIPAARYFNIQSSNVNENIYQNFKKYLFNNNGKTLKENYNNFRAEFFIENPESEMWEFPSYFSVTLRLKKDIIQTKDESLSQFYTIAKKADIITDKKFGFLDFKSAAIDYLNCIQKEKKLKKATLKKYNSYINIHLIPSFENYRLDDITDKLIDEYKSVKLQQQISPESIKSQILLLRKILYIYLPEKVEYKKIKDKEIEFRILKPYEIKNLLKSSKEYDELIYLSILTIINSGITIGELIALKWDKIHWNNCSIFVNCTMHQGKITLHKMQNARRMIKVPESLLSLLKEYGNKSDSYIFQNSKCNFIDAEKIISEKFTHIADKVKLGDLKFMDLRDTYAAILIEKKLPLTFIQKQLGHSSVKVTADRYKKLIDKQNPETLEFDKEIFD